MFRYSEAAAANASLSLLKAQNRAKLEKERGSGGVGGTRNEKTYYDVKPMLA
jgi:hypothetical protein